MYKWSKAVVGPCRQEARPRGHVQIVGASQGQRHHRRGIAGASQGLRNHSMGIIVTKESQQGHGRGITGTNDRILVLTCVLAVDFTKMAVKIGSWLHDTSPLASLITIIRHKHKCPCDWLVWVPYAWVDVWKEDLTWEFITGP